MFHLAHLLKISMRNTFIIIRTGEQLDIQYGKHRKRLFFTMHLQKRKKKLITVVINTTVYYILSARNKINS